MSNEIIILNKKVDVIDKNNGLLKSIPINGKSVEISQNFYYKTSNGNLSSGAYVMHTNSSNPTLILRKLFSFSNSRKISRRSCARI
jgi:hypothetical protein